MTQLSLCNFAKPDAPTYEEIAQDLRTINKLLYDEMQAGSLHESLPPLDEYQPCLRGRKAENWVGWVRGLETTIFEPVRPYYNVSIYMELPTLGTLERSQVLLIEVPVDQVQKLKIWQDPTQIYGPWQKVKLSGTISGTTGVDVLILDPVIEPLE